MTHSPTTAPPSPQTPASSAATPAPATTSSSRRPLALALATLAVLALLVLSLSTGEYSILSQDDGWRIFLAVRVPRTIALILSGAAMSMSGLVMQLVTQNRFAEPSTTGTTEWAGLGLLVIMIAWPGAPILVRMTCAITFAFAGTMVFFALLRRVSLRSSSCPCQPASTRSSPRTTAGRSSWPCVSPARSRSSCRVPRCR